jgi:hypothetical protein
VELRNFGTSELRNFGTLELRNFGTSELWNFAYVKILKSELQALQALQAHQALIYIWECGRLGIKDVLKETGEK